ncbi:hypothetical protein [Fulvivirga kasyanovii]|uniref:STAS/SEC14 domain-containing protein n=2 Tax=Fulvivirga kasyanovii TaxID=396812 RepID=A0ABW9RN44_9BACT|nr:hypothetical protein [Fulvivirga kasyanovii]MTI25532.1 hypothetical protein [Fulvivirga kasyanovii]
METTLLHQTGTATIEFDASVPCLIHSPNGFMTSDEFREQMNVGLQLLKEKKSEMSKIAWLADARNQEVISQEDIAWIASNWNARVFEVGVRHIALVPAEDELSSMSIETYIDSSEGAKLTKGLIIRQFIDVESAKKWLRDMMNGA